MRRLNSHWFCDSVTSRVAMSALGIVCRPAGWPTMQVRHGLLVPELTRSAALAAGGALSTASLGIPSHLSVLQRSVPRPLLPSASLWNPIIILHTSRTWTPSVSVCLQSLRQPASTSLLWLHRLSETLCHARAPRVATFAFCTHARVYVSLVPRAVAINNFRSCSFEGIGLPPTIHQTRTPTTIIITTMTTRVWCPRGTQGGGGQPALGPETTGMREKDPELAGLSAALEAALRAVVVAIAAALKQHRTPHALRRQRPAVASTMLVHLYVVHRPSFVISHNSWRLLTPNRRVSLHLPFGSRN